MQCKYCGEDNCKVCEEVYSIEDLAKILKFNEDVAVQVAKHGYYETYDNQGRRMIIEADSFRPDNSIDWFECWYDDDHSETTLSPTPWGAYCDTLKN